MLLNVNVKQKLYLALVFWYKIYYTRLWDVLFRCVVPLKTSTVVIVNEGLMLEVYTQNASSCTKQKLQIVITQKITSVFFK